MALLAKMNAAIGQKLSIENIRQLLEQCDPVIVLVDMDCFYVQVEQLDKPETRGQPCAVVQFTDTGDGSIIALSYEAKARGVSRFRHTKEAKEACPEIHLFTVPSRYQKADIGRYRAAGNRVVEVIQSHFSVVSKASVDESYIDASAEARTFIVDALNSSEIGEVENSWFFIKPEMFNSTEVYGYSAAPATDSGDQKPQRSIDAFIDSTFKTLIKSPEDGRSWNNLLQLAGAVLLERLRTDILAKLEFHCSAGFASSKSMAKLCCGINKPRRQTILPATQLRTLLAATPLNKIRSYGGKYGHEVQDKLQIQNVGDLIKFSREQLVAALGEKNGLALFRFANYGLDGEEVKAHDQAKSIGSSKNFPGANCLKTLYDLQKWVMAFSEELKDRVIRDTHETNRIPTLLTVHLRYYKLSDLAPNLLQNLLKGGKIGGRDYYLLSGYSTSRCAPLHGEWTQGKIFQHAMKIILKHFPCYQTHKLYAGNGEPNRTLPGGKNSETDVALEDALPAEFLQSKVEEAAESMSSSSSSTLAKQELVYLSFVMLCASKMQNQADDGMAGGGGIRQFLVPVKRDRSSPSSDPVIINDFRSTAATASPRKKSCFSMEKFFSKKSTEHMPVNVERKNDAPIECITLSDSSNAEDDVAVGNAQPSAATSSAARIDKTSSSVAAMAKSRAESSPTMKGSKTLFGRKRKAVKNPRIDKFLRKISKAERHQHDDSSGDDNIVILSD